MGEFGIFGSFGQGEPCAEEDEKGWYDPKQKMVLEIDMGIYACYWPTRTYIAQFEFTDPILHQFQ